MAGFFFNDLEGEVEMKKIVMMVVGVVIVANVSLADLVCGIDIDFVTIGNAGNMADTGGTPGCGAVSYDYRIGKYEVTNAQWDAFTTTAGIPTGDTGNDGGYSYPAYFTGAQQPVTGVSWYEAVQFCNYLTSGDKSQGVYQFSGNNTNPGVFLGIDRAAAQAVYGTIYVLPTEDEWYKAAYYKPDGSGYSLYANGLSTVPPADNGWNWDGGSYSTPWNVGTGTEEQNGTFDMMGNVNEWNELIVGSHRSVRGGYYSKTAATSVSSHQSYSPVAVYEIDGLGFRIAAVPEPCTLSLLAIGALPLLRKKRKA